MSNYTISKKSKPRGAKYILFNFKNDPKNGIIDFIDVKKLSLIEDINRAIIPEETIEINFPAIQKCLKCFCFFPFKLWVGGVRITFRIALNHFFTNCYKKGICH